VILQKIIQSKKDELKNLHQSLGDYTTDRQIKSEKQSASEGSRRP
jgi:hypothetical protein